MENAKRSAKIMALCFVILTVVNLLQVWKVYTELNAYAAQRVSTVPVVRYNARKRAPTPAKTPSLPAAANTVR